MKTGVDIVEIKRIEKIMEKRRETFYKKIFTSKEVEYIKSKNHNSKTVAGIFASKEAVSKMLGTGIGIINWKDIEIIYDEKGRPLVNINSKILHMLNKEGLDSIDISISHERKYAISFAIGFKST